MYWTKFSKCPPPVDIFVYALYGEMVVPEKFGEEDIKNFSAYFLLTEEEKEEKEYEGDIVPPPEYWSFIPLWDPAEVAPYLTKLNQAVMAMEQQIIEIRQELACIPRHNSLLRLIEQLRTEIAQSRPDAYHSWKVKRLERGYSSVPINGEGISPPPDNI